MKTIAQALKDEVHYPISSGYIENKLICRGLDGASPIVGDILRGNEFRGAVADCLYSLVEAPNLSESDKSITLPERNLILKKANAIYKDIGEPEKFLNEPTVQFGW